MLIEWKPIYSVGIDVIDAQHKTLLKYMNLFHDAHLAGDFNLSKRALQALLKYTLKHFESEEKMMLKYDYPDYSAHKKGHEELLKLVSSLSETYMRSHEEQVAQRLASLLQRWISGHIMSMDKGYTKFLKQEQRLQQGKLM